MGAKRFAGEHCSPGGSNCLAAIPRKARACDGAPNDWRVALLPWGMPAKTRALSQLRLINFSPALTIWAQRVATATENDSDPALMRRASQAQRP